MDRNVVGWFELPVQDMERAIKFYETVLDLSLSRQDMGGLDMAWFPFMEGAGAPGSLVRDEQFYRPSTDGVLIYFTCHSGDLNNELARVEGAGGQVLQSKTLIAEGYGYMAICLDTEGNRIALHSTRIRRVNDTPFNASIARRFGFAQRPISACSTTSFGLFNDP